MDIDVSVPCGSCSSAIRFGQRACPHCGAKVQKEVRQALDARLEASSTDFRALRNRVREVAVLLIILGSLHLLIGTFVFFFTPSNSDPMSIGSARIGFSLDCIIGIGMLVAARFVEMHPKLTSVLTFAGWAAVQILVPLLFPATLLQGILAKFIVIVVLSRGYVAASTAEKIQKRLADQFG